MKLFTADLSVKCEERKKVLACSIENFVNNIVIHMCVCVLMEKTERKDNLLFVSRQNCGSNVSSNPK